MLLFLLLCLYIKILAQSHSQSQYGLGNILIILKFLFHKYLRSTWWNPICLLITSKSINGKTTKYYYDGTRLVKQDNGNNSIIFLYDRNDEVIGFTYFCSTTVVDDPVMTECFLLDICIGQLLKLHTSRQAYLFWLNHGQACPHNQKLSFT